MNVNAMNHPDVVRQLRDHSAYLTSGPQEDADRGRGGELRFGCSTSTTCHRGRGAL